MSQEKGALTLEALNLYAQQCISGQQERELLGLPAGKWDVHIKRALNFEGMAVVMYGLIYGQKQDHVFPADWWEALKDRWAPAWAKRRWPVRYTVVSCYRGWENLPIPANWGKEIYVEYVREVKGDEERVLLSDRQ